MYVCRYPFDFLYFCGVYLGENQNTRLLFLFFILWITQNALRWGGIESQNPKRRVASGLGFWLLDLGIWPCFQNWFGDSPKKWTLIGLKCAHDRDGCQTSMFRLWKKDFDGVTKVLKYCQLLVRPLVHPINEFNPWPVKQRGSRTSLLNFLSTTHARLLSPSPATT